MTNYKSPVRIKRKIVGGFLLLLTLVFLSVFSIIKLAKNLYPPDPGISSSAMKLTLTSNLLSSLIEADGQARAFISTGDTAYLEAFYNQQDRARNLVDSLANGSVGNTNQYLRIIAVDSLLNLKITTYQNYFELRENSLNTGTIDISQIAARYRDTIITIPDKRINQTITQQIEPREKQSRKKGFFPRLWDNITGRNKEEFDSVSQKRPIITYDTITTYRKVHDNTLSQVKWQLKRYQEQKNLEKQLVAERELMLVRADQDIMNEIRAVLLLFEKEEIANALAETEKSHKLLDNLWITALILAGTGLIATIAFLILIWKDLARSAYYRRQLEEARSLAESLLKVKEQFLANMSHEIRTPLTSIIGFTERLSDTNITTEQSRYLRYINSSSEHLLELINDLLDFSRIDSGKLSLESKAFNAQELFESAYEALASRAIEKGLDISIKQNLPGMYLIGDPLRLRQIVINLLANSIKFTESGKILLQTKADFSEDKKQANLLIRVADTGIGIPDNKQNTIFEEFSQVDPGITRKYGGSGLGLAITRKLVDVMGGTIRVLSREGQGTIFTIRLTLPVAEGIAPIDHPTEEMITDLHEVNILLAEDDPTTRLLLNEFLEKYNATVYPASDGLEAIHLFKEDPSTFQLVITDIQMPHISGPELVSNIKAICDESNIPLPIIIGLTAHADTSTIELYKQSGMDYFILKPFRNIDLKEVFSSISHQIKLKISHTPPDEKITRHAVESKVKIVEATAGSKLEPDLTGEKKNGEANLNFTSFRKFAGDDNDSFNRIITSLSYNLESTIEQMKDSFHNKDFSNLGLLAHRMQPNIKLLGAGDTASTLRELEVVCKSDILNEKLIYSKFRETITHLNYILTELSKHKLTTEN